MPHFGHQVKIWAWSTQPNSCKQVAFVAGVQGKAKRCRAVKVARRPYIWFKKSLNLRCFSSGISLKHILHVGTSHSSILVTTYFFCNEWQNLFFKICICKSHNCGTNFEEGFFPPKIFCGLSTQQLQYRFKLFKNFYMCRRLSFL